jgi:hypothetical protein
MTQHDPTTQDPHEESARVTGKEIALFSLFGLIPLIILYIFASQGAQDAEGAAFEQDRRVLLDDCRHALRDLDACRDRVDTHIIACAGEHPRPEPLTDAYMLAMRTCINEGSQAWTLPPPKPPNKRR